MKMFDFMKTHGFTPTIHSYQAMILTCAKRYGHYVQAFDYYKEMVAQGLQPDLMIYNALMFACAFHGDVSTLPPAYSP